MKLFLLLIVFVLLCIPGFLFSQDLVVKPYGVSPEDVKADTVGDPTYLGIRDIRFSGLKNVGVGTKVYLIGTFEDSSLTSLAWNMYEVPATSAATLAAPVALDSASEVTTFIADLAGTYRISVSEGMLADTVVINATTYRGVEGSAPNCSNCHSTTFTEFQQTGHAHFLVNALDGMGRSGQNCLPCHTTGWDTSATAANNGFDDFAFVYPDTQFVGMADSMRTQYPDAMVRANIQCESCHGPGNEHITNSSDRVGDSRMIVSLGVEACAYCHDDDHYHVYPSQFETAGHSDPPSYPGGSRTDCRGCHNGMQFIQYAENATITQQPAVAITCAVCHDPHNATNEHQIRTVQATLSNGQAVTAGGTGKLCMNCHQSRRDAATYPNTPKSHFGPHYAPQADIILGTNVVTFGETLPSSPHLSATNDACVDCHMWENGSHGEHDAQGNLTTSGMHSFNMVNVNGIENVAACEGAGCHGPIGTSFADKRYYVNGNADHDGDGVQEGLQDEVHGMLDTLASILPAAPGHDVFDAHDDPDSTWTLTELQAAYNYKMVYYDHSYGIHNPAFTVSLMRVSIDAVRDMLASVDETPGITPVSYEMSQNYPNPFNPTTEIKFSIMKPGHVTLTVYDMLGREVIKLVDKEMQAGTYRTRFDASNLASGVYVYRIIAGNGDFTSIRKMVLLR